MLATNSNPLYSYELKENHALCIKGPYTEKNPALHLKFTTLKRCQFLLMVMAASYKN